jgi:asparagine synthase (glutamine-hydrolysing)
MDYNIAEHFHKVLKTPYLDKAVVKSALQVPVEFKVNNGERKIILKKVAMELGLPVELVEKEKKAAQYSSGIIKELRRMAKQEGMAVNELIERLIHN